MKNRGRIIAFFLIVLLFAGLIGSTVSGITKKINLGLDLQGGFEVLYDVKPVDKSQKVDKKLLEATVRTLTERVDKLGISESSIDIEEPNRIRVQLAGVKDQTEARKLLSTSARLSFRDVDDKELMNGSDVKEGSAKQDFSQDTKKPIVTLKMKDKSKFKNVTSKLKDRHDDKTPYPDNLMVIWMDHNKGDSFADEYGKKDHKYISAPQVSKTINSPDVMIEGNFTVDSAQRLADIINSGSLPVNLQEKYSTSVGAQFGAEALHKTVFAGVIGVSVIFLFMMAVYRFPGVIASINLSIYIYLILLVFELMHGVLTLPGIAALILGVGMAVDANVITFERIREELREGKSLQAAFKSGTSNSLRAILDANITTILAAAVLFVFGTSSVRGFATMLIISILVSFVTAVYGTRALMQLWIKTKFLKNHPGWFGVKQRDIRDIRDKTEVEPKLFNREINPVKHRNKFFIGSSLMIILGAIALLTFHLNPGIDFTSGSRVQIKSDHALTTKDVTHDLDELGIKPKNTPIISGEKKDSAVIRYDSVLKKDKIADLKEYFSDKYGSEPSVSVVSPVVGKELVRNALFALAIASVGMIIYVAFRFELFFAVTAIIALIHDAFFILAFFSFTRLEFDINIVAAVLTIIGYSINDTIVTFDRIRENLQKRKRVKSFKELAKIVNRSLVQTMTRSVNTSLTTLIAVLAFLFLGADSIGGFAIALTVGLIMGTYSSLFVASQLWLVWRGKRIKKKPVSFEKKKKIEGPQV